MDIGQVNQVDMQRLAYIDAMKGLAMIMVLIGHILIFCGGNYDNPIITNIVLINMPLFFFVNGILVKCLPPPSSKHQSVRIVWHIVARKMWQLIVPFLAWGLIISVDKGAGYDKFFLSEYKMGYWYLLVLFEFFVILGLIDFITLRYPKLRYWQYDVLIFCVLFFLLTRISRFGGTVAGTIVDYWKVTELVPYFYFGSLIKRYSLHKYIDNVVTCSAALITTVVLYYLWHRYGLNLYLTIVLRCSMITLIYVFFKNLSSIDASVIGRQLCLIGRNTFIIYMVQYYLFRFVNLADVLPYLYASNNILAIIVLTAAVGVVISWICICVGKVLDRCYGIRNALMGKLPQWMEARL